MIEKIYKNKYMATCDILNSGDCCEACEECDGESHVRGCPMFGDPE